MNRIILFFTLFLATLTVRASHIVGGEIYYDYLGNNTYKIYIALYRDCASTGAEYDDPASIGFFSSSNILLREVSANFNGSQQQPLNFSNPCIQPPSGICVEKTIYVETVTNLPPRVGGYIVSYTRCCRGPNVENITNPSDVGITLVTRIPGSETGFAANSSPRFNSSPPLVICAGQPFTFNHAATDPDSDVLVYDMIAPFQGGTSGDPAPAPPPNPPYNLVPWDPGYTAAQPLGANGNVSIDPNTGVLTATPGALGLFAVGVRVREYRGGVLVGETRRDFLWKIVSCIVNLDAILDPQGGPASNNGPCSGLTIQFDNNSFGGTNYAWDFGVLGITTDVSNAFEPTYTFPAPGTYQVKLVVNPGWTCRDSSFQTFIINEGINVDIVSNDSVCVDGNQIDFTGINIADPATILTWNFGPNATPQTGSGVSVQNVVFDTSGVFAVTVNAVLNQCSTNNLDSVTIFGHIKNNFNVPPGLQCAPFTVTFIDSTEADVPISYLWDFGDNSATSNLQEPTHTYLESGVYDISLTIQSFQGCFDLVTLVKPNLVQVKETPESNFSITPPITDIYNLNFQFTDLSVGATSIWYWFNDSTFSQEPNPIFSYFEGGDHEAKQVVINEFGCKDSSYQSIYITPETTIYIPNTFTPDGNGFNNIWQPVVYDTREYELIIYNRWGQEILFTNDPKEGWDGKCNNFNSPDGVYQYKIRYISFKKEGYQEIIGHFNLLR